LDHGHAGKIGSGHLLHLSFLIQIFLPENLALIGSGPLSRSALNFLPLFHPFPADFQLNSRPMKLFRQL
jgi:hypothetical protein